MNSLLGYSGSTRNSIEDYVLEQVTVQENLSKLMLLKEYYDHHSSREDPFFKPTVVRDSALSEIRSLRNRVILKIVEINKERLHQEAEVLARECNDLKGPWRIDNHYRPPGEYILVKNSQPFDIVYEYAGEKSPKEFINSITSVACVKEIKRVEGYYQPSSRQIRAIWLQYEIYLFDRNARKVIANNFFNGQSPPRRYGGKDDFIGRPPHPSEIDQWIRSLPIKH